MECRLVGLGFLIDILQPKSIELAFLYARRHDKTPGVLTICVLIIIIPLFVSDHFFLESDVKHCCLVKYMMNISTRGSVTWKFFMMRLDFLSGLIKYIRSRDQQEVN